MNIKKVAILTSGGDAPGMNKLVYTCCELLKDNNIEPYVVIDGYKGLYNNDIRPANMWILETNANVSGSVIYCSRFENHREEAILKQEAKNLKAAGIDVLIVVGGNGSYAGAKCLIQHGVKVMCLPATIDNDINFTEFTIGFNSALSAIVDTIDNLNMTAKTHGNVYLIEAMGRDCSDLTLAAALSARVDYIVTKYNKLTDEQYLKIINEMKTTRRSILFLISEKIYDDVAYLTHLRKYLEAETGIPTKAHIIGFIQRGAKPTAMERFQAWRLAKYCVDNILKGNLNVAVGIKDDKELITPLLDHDFKKHRSDKELLKMIDVINNKKSNK